MGLKGGGLRGWGGVRREGVGNMLGRGEKIFLVDWLGVVGKNRVLASVCGVAVYSNEWGGSVELSHFIKQEKQARTTQSPHSHCGTKGRGSGGCHDEARIFIMITFNSNCSLPVFFG
jgi:hypothetical protein